MDNLITNETFDASKATKRIDQEVTNDAVASDYFADTAPLESTSNSESVENDFVSTNEISVHPVEEAIPMGKNLLIVDSMDELITEENSTANEKIAPETDFVANTDTLATLLNHDDSGRFRAHWNEIQSKFVDDPSSAVQEADGLVSEVVEQITKMFAVERSTLEDQWRQGNDADTEDLRKALQHYRSFFNRLVV